MAKQTKSGTRRNRDSKSSSSAIRGRVNHRQTLELYLRQPVENADGPGRTLAQSVENSIDAGAGSIVIRFGEWQGDFAVFIEDDGVGMKYADLKSAAGFGFTSKVGEDAKHLAGVVGTGSKLWLGICKDIGDVQLTYITRSMEAGSYQVVLDFEYLVALAQDERRVSSPVASLEKLPKWWNEYFPGGRETGTTLIVTGIDKTRMWNIPDILTRLSGHIVPRVARLVKVVSINDGSVYALEPPDFSGELFEFSETFTTLGRVDTTLFVGNTGGQLVVCAPNAILHPFVPSLRRFGARRSEVPDIFSKVAGYITIENARKWKRHDGSFDPSFYQGDAVKELVSLLLLVAPDVEAKVAKVERDEQHERMRRNLRLLRIANRELFDVPAIEGGDEEDKVKGGVPDSSPSPRRQLGPSLKRMPVESVRTIGISDPDGIIREPEKTRWIITDMRLARIISDDRGAQIQVQSGSLTGTTVLTLLNKDFPDTGELVSSLSVYKPIDTMRIVGPSRVVPGSNTLYRLVDFGEGVNPNSISWSKDWLTKVGRGGRRYQQSLRGVTLVDKDADTVILQCDPDCENGVVYVRARPHMRSDVIVTKKVQVVEPETTEGESVWSIGFRYYKVVSSWNYATLANVVNEDDEIPVIEVNSEHPLLGVIRADEQTILFAIARAAFLSQRSQRYFASDIECLTAADEFVFRMLTKRFSR